MSKAPDFLPKTFSTRRLCIRDMKMTDAEAIFRAFAGDALVARFMSWMPHAEVAETHAYVAGRLAVDPDISKSYVLCRQTDAMLLGSLTLRRVNAYSAEVGYALGRTWWNRGIMTEALSAVVSCTFAETRIMRVGAVCDVENSASVRVLEKVGMEREGLLRRWLVHPNIGTEPRDCYIYSRIRN